MEELQKELEKDKHYGQIHNLINLMWTGGWDSTFRLLQSVIINKNYVQPHYILDTNRKSLRNELLAMGKIKESLFEDFPFTKKHLLPTIFFPKSEITISNRLNDIYQKLNGYLPMGTQYGWMAQYCQSNNINNMELSIEKHTGGYRYDTMKKHLKLKEIHGESVYVMDERYEGEDFYEVFKCYIWPIMDLDRTMMLKIAEEYNFSHLLNKTWFCHNPLKGNKPCGICIPCIQVYEEHNKSYLTSQARMRYHFRNILSTTNFQNAYPKLHRTLKKLKFFKKVRKLL